MKRLRTWMFFLLLTVAGIWWVNPDLPAKLGFVKNDSSRILMAWDNRESNHIVEFDARVVLLFPDQVDVTGTFQQFRVELENRHSLIVSHDLKVAPAVPLSVGSELRIKGEYDWSERGGIVHWTHEDPSGFREGGWIEYDGRLYR